MSRLKQTGLALAILALSVSRPAASPNRVVALGGEARLLLDTSSIFLYPGAALEFPHLGVELFDDWGGVVYPLGERHAVGLFLDRPTPQLERLNAYLGQNGSALFRELEARPVADLVYGLRLRENLRLGLLGRVERDLREGDFGKAATTTWDVRVGAQWGSAGRPVWEVAAGLLRQHLEDDDPAAAGPPMENTDGTGYLLAARGRLPLGPALTILPSVGFESTPYGLAPTRREAQAGHAGLGLNLRPNRGVLVVAGLVTSFERAEEQRPAQPSLAESIWVLPAAVIGGEVQVGSMLFRLGLRHENRLAARDELLDGLVSTWRDLVSAFRADLGLGLELGSLRLDGLVERDFLRDGPHIIGGSRHGGGLFANLGLSYQLGN